MALVFVGSFFAFESKASGKKDNPLSDANFDMAMFGKGEDGSEFMVALYNTRNSKIAYINDGTSFQIGEYKVANVKTAEFGTVQRFKVGDEYTFDYIELDGEQYLISENGTVYESVSIDEEAVDNMIRMA